MVKVQVLQNIFYSGITEIMTVLNLMLLISLVQIFLDQLSMKSSKMCVTVEKTADFNHLIHHDVSSLAEY